MKFIDSVLHQPSIAAAQLSCSIGIVVQVDNGYGIITAQLLLGLAVFQLCKCWHKTRSSGLIHLRAKFSLSKKLIRPSSSMVSLSTHVHNMHHGCCSPA
jgi:hypothetical protein